jgi:hypothetical protein
VGFLFENPYQAGVSLRGVVRFFSGFGVGFWRFFTKTTLKIYLYRLNFARHWCIFLVRLYAQ